MVVSPRLTKMMKESDISDLFWVGFVSSFVTAIYVLLLSYCGQLIKDVALQGWIIKVVPPEHFSAVSSTQLIGKLANNIVTQTQRYNNWTNLWILWSDASHS